MLLEKSGIFNDFSPELKEKLRTRVEGFGKRVRYKFDISHDNPDPQKESGNFVWPFKYTLDPCTFTITDPYEKDKTKSRLKQVGLVERITPDGKPEKFLKIRIIERHKGVYELDLTNEEHFERAMYLELHPKNSNGMFPDPSKHQVFSRIDEAQESKQKKETRTLRVRALQSVAAMSDKDIKDFADAFLWDSTEDIGVLRNRVEEEADINPESFMDFINSKNVEYMSVVKRGLDKKVIAFDPAEYKLVWSANNQIITKLQPSPDKNHVEDFSIWFQTGGKSADAVFKRLKELIN